MDDLSLQRAKFLPWLWRDTTLTAVHYTEADTDHDMETLSDYINYDNPAALYLLEYTWDEGYVISPGHGHAMMDSMSKNPAAAYMKEASPGYSNRGARSKYNTMRQPESPDDIKFYNVFANPLCIDMIEPYLINPPETFPVPSISTKYNDINERLKYINIIISCTLSRNPAAIDLLKKYPNKISWPDLIQNPSAIELIDEFITSAPGTYKDRYGNIRYEHLTYHEASKNPNLSALMRYKQVREAIKKEEEHRLIHRCAELYYLVRYLERRYVANRLRNLKSRNGRRIIGAIREAECPTY